MKKVRYLEGSRFITKQ